MTSRVIVTRTHKLFINGAFPRSESGRSLPVAGAKGEIIAHLCLASRKDWREAVEAAAKAQPGWWNRTAYNRGQILYRLAEMLEGRKAEFIDALKSVPTRARGKANTGAMTAAKEVDLAIDRLVCFAGWCDKFTTILGGENPVAGPFYNFTTPEPIGVAALVAPDRPALLGLISLLAPALCAGNACVLFAGEANPIPACLLGEVCATSDVPAGVVNILTGSRPELLKEIANHRNVGLIAAAGLNGDDRRTLELGSADNLKRVTVFDWKEADYRDPDVCENPWTIEPFVDLKTIWHPSAM